MEVRMEVEPVRVLSSELGHRVEYILPQRVATRVLHLHQLPSLHVRHLEKGRLIPDPNGAVVPGPQMQLFRAPEYSRDGVMEGVDDVARVEVDCVVEDVSRVMVDQRPYPDLVPRFLERLVTQQLLDVLLYYDTTSDREVGTQPAGRPVHGTVDCLKITQISMVKACIQRVYTVQCTRKGSLYSSV